jgi:hypothetical protein
MASTVSLDLDGNTFQVLKCLCKCEQGFDQNGNPSTGVSAGSISLLLEGSGEDDFAGWICDQQAKDGTVTFSIDDSSFKKIEFKNGYLVKLHESFHGEGEVNLNRWDRFTEFDSIAENYIYEEVTNYQQRSGISYIVQCSISAEKVSIDGVDHDNQW